MTPTGTSAGGVLVVGFGVTGRAVAAYLRAQGRRVVVVDDAARGDAAHGDAAGTEFYGRLEGDRLARLVADVDLVVPSPGVPAAHPVFAAARAAGRPVVSEIELAFGALVARAQPRPRLVAITGTNGKTTVTTLVTHILAAAGISAVAGGNIGRPLIDAVSSDVDVVVAEVSSFQLEWTSSFRPDVSCWLNFAEDHLDWHADLAHYAAAKARIWEHQGPGDVAVHNVGDPWVAEMARRIPEGVTRIGFSPSGQTGPFPDTGPFRETDFCVVGGHLVGPGRAALMAVGALPRGLPHDLDNALAAAAVAMSCGAGAPAVRHGLISAPGLAHRVALVAEQDGVRWYDDSKATTPASVKAAVAGFDSVVLVAGGRNKGLDLTALGDTVPPVRRVVAIGEAAPEVARAFAGRAPVDVATSMERAVDLAGSVAVSGDCVILSPGCASFDWYRSYAERGDDFAATVHRLLRSPQHPTSHQKGRTPC